MKRFRIEWPSMDVVAAAPAAPVLLLVVIRMMMVVVVVVMGQQCLVCGVSGWPTWYDHQADLTVGVTDTLYLAACTHHALIHTALIHTACMSSIHLASLIDCKPAFTNVGVTVNSKWHGGGGSV